MKNQIKKLKSSMYLVFATLFLLSNLSCDMESFEDSIDSENHSTYQIKKISLNELKINRKALEKLKETHIKMTTSEFGRGVYNEDFGMFIDTTNIILIEKDGKQSITFQIMKENAFNKIENLVLNSKEDGGYSAFITEYLLSQSDIIKLANNEQIDTRTPTRVTDLSSSSSNNYTINNVNCVSIITNSVWSCYNSSGEIIDSQGNLGDGCIGGGFEVTYLIIQIDWGCVSGGGGGGSTSGGYNSGSNGTGNGPGNNSGGGSTGGNGSQNNPFNQIVTTPVIKIPLLPKQFLLSLSPSQVEWWNAIENSSLREKLTEYINQNTVNTQVEPYALAFVLELITLANQNPSFYNYNNISNWFFTPREGQDFFYDTSYWDNPNIVFPQQDLPSWDDFDLAYPREEGADLVLIVGGAVELAYNNYPSLSRGYCALKVSRALNYSGITIPQITTSINNPGTIQGSDGKYYFLNAKALNKWMRKTFGTNPATSFTPYNGNHVHIDGSEGGENGLNFPDLVLGLKGIYSMVSTNSQWASGHADLIQDGLCVFGCHFHDIPPAPIEYIDIWILE
jgi:hypothetical protein